MVTIERIADDADGAGLAEELPAVNLGGEDVGGRDVERAVVEDAESPVRAVLQIEVQHVEVRERGDGVELRDQPAIAQHVAHEDDRLGDQELIRGDAAVDLHVVDEEPAAARLLDLLRIDRHFHRRLEGRPRLGLQRRGGERHLLRGVKGLVRGRGEKLPVLFVVRREHHPLAVVLAGEDHRREAAAHHVGVLQQVAGLEVERVDVVRGEVGRIGRRRVALALGLVLGFFQDVRRLLHVAAGLAVRGVEDALAIGREPGVDVVPLAAGELVALGRLGQIQLEQLGVAADHRRVDQPLAVGGEDGRAVEEMVVGQVRHRAGRGVVEEDVRLAAAERGEGDGLAVGRIGGIELLLRVGQRHVALDGAGQHVDEHQVAAALLLHEERDLIAARREGHVASHHRTGGQRLHDRILVLARVAAGEVAHHHALGDVEERDVRVFLVRHHRRQQIAGGRRHRRDVLAFDPLPDLERLAVLLRLPFGHQRGEVLLAQPGAEARVELVGGDVEGALEGLVHRTA